MKSGLTKSDLDIILPYVRGTSKADGFAGHFCSAEHCRFILHHHVLSKSGKRYKVSSVGAMIHGKSGKREEIASCGRLFETMAFIEEADTSQNGSELEVESAKDSIECTANHYDMVGKYENL